MLANDFGSVHERVFRGPPVLRDDPAMQTLTLRGLTIAFSDDAYLLARCLFPLSLVSTTPK